MCVSQPAALCSVLKLYAEIDQRCIQLATLFRLWAKVQYACTYTCIYMYMYIQYKSIKKFPSLCNSHSNHSIPFRFLFICFCERKDSIVDACVCVCMCAGVLCGPAGEWTLPGSHVCGDGNLLPAADWSTASTAPGTLFIPTACAISTWMGMYTYLYTCMYMFLNER